MNVAYFSLKFKDRKNKIIGLILDGGLGGQAQ